MKTRTSLILCALAVLGLVAVQPVQAATLIWDADGAPPYGGTGPWNTTNLYWYDSGTSSYKAWVNANNDTAYFGTAFGTVTLSTGITVGGLSFNDSAGYLITGNTLTFGVAGSITTNVDATIASILAGNVLITKLGTGKLTLQTASTRTGGTQIDAGTVRIENITAFGTAAAPITINSGGTLEIGTTSTVANGTGTITLNNGGTISSGLAGTAARIDKTITVQNSATAVVSFDSGANAANVLIINGGGDNRLTGGATGAKIQIKGSGEVDPGGSSSTRASNVTADWYLQGGKFWIRADTELGDAANDIYFQGGTLSTQLPFTLGASRVLDFSNASGGTVDTTGGNLTLNTAGHLAGANLLTKAGANSLIIQAANAGFSGGTTINAGTVNFTNRAALYNDTSANWTPTKINVASAATLMVGVGAGGSGYFDTGNLDTLLDGAHMGLSTPATGLKTGAILGLDTTNAASATFTYNSNITDPGTSTGMGLTKIGAGTLVLGGTNTYTGNTTVSAGALSIASTSALPGWNTNGRYSVASGAALTVGNGVSDADFATIRGTTNFVAGSVNGFDTTAGNRTYAGTFTGTIGLWKIGANKLTLTGNSSGATIGAMQVNAGTLEISGGGYLYTGSGGTTSTVGTGASDSNVIVDIIGTGSAASSVWRNSGEIQVGQSGDNNFLTISNGGKLWAGGGSDHISIGNNNGSDNNTILVTGAGSSLVAEDYLMPGRGGSGNTLRIEAGATASCYLFWSSGGTGNPSTSSNTTVTTTGSGSTLSVTSTWDIGDRGSGNYFNVLNGGVVNMAGGGGYVGYYTGNAAVVVDGLNSVFNTAAVDWSNGGSSAPCTVSNGGRYNANGQITFRNNNNFNLNGGTNGPGELNVQTLNLAAAGGRLNFNGGRLIAQSSGSLISGSGQINLIGTGYVKTDYTRTIGVVIYGNGDLIKEGTGNLTLTNQDTYTAGTRIDAGTLTLGHATNTLLDAGAVNVNGGILALGNAGAYSDTVGAVTLTSGSITGSTGVLTGSSYAVKSGTISAKLGGAGALAKSTAGTVTLSGVNTYSGNTTISNGILALTGSIANSPVIDVAAGTFDVSGVGGGYNLGASQTLKGNGTVIGPMTAAGTVEPGASIGILNVTGNATLNGTFKVEVETDGTSDKLAVTGNLVLGGASILNVVDTLKLVLGKTYTIATYGTQSGTFATNNLPTAPMWQVNYGTGTNDAITLTPEPATLALMGLGGLGLILSRKRR